ncbi:energy-coupling factor transport system ATP-binding protein [Pedococcus dokdonensis]|uniref:Energy-coupling factor transport system ATP-binding protein n=1 Tax=Pedococcus dokdonensis TaxID=443156 RepID=A0A1H0MRC9_9MICO|nr:ABC transporter ATP-binding protein [Pedococcus dokdonensis]SDO82884.1 energy-coupling factor transport system ATP-binding protein [Pedococcus dokdonensis]
MIELEAVTLAHAGQPVLRDVTFAVPEGELVLVVGPTGSGKTSLLRCLDAGLAQPADRPLADPPDVALHGRVVVDGIDLHAPGGGRSGQVGFVRQDPARHLAAGTVESVVAAAVPDRGADPHGGQRRVEETLDLLGLADLRARPVTELSGGQQQRVAIAVAVVADPRVLVLDEPTSALDPVAAEEVLAILHRLVHDVGTTVVIAEHRLERVVHHADAVLLVAAGRVTGPLPPGEAMHRSGLRPPVVELGVRLGWDPLPLSVRAARRAARPLRDSLAVPGRSVPPASQLAPQAAGDAATDDPSGDRVAPLLEARRLSVVRDRVVALRSVSLRLGGGEVVALMGRNGSGKSTLLSTVVGSPSPTSGRVTLTGPAALAPQDPRDLLDDDTVAAQLSAHDTDQRLPAGAGARLLRRLAPDVGLERRPAELSEGQRMAVALALVFSREAQVVLLDEPTRGLDYATKARLVTLVAERAAAGCGVVVATHDVELAAEVATRCVVLAEGEVVADGPARQVLADSPAFAPQAAKVMHPAPLLRVSEVVAAALGGASR